MDPISTILELLFTPIKNLYLKIQSYFKKEVDPQVESVFHYTLNDFFKNEVGYTTRIKLKKAVHAYMKSPTSFKPEDRETRDFIDCFKKRLAEPKHQAAYNYLSRLENREEHTQIMATIKEKGLDPREIEHYLKRLPIKEGQVKAEQGIEDLYQSREIELPLRETLQIIVRNLFEHSADLLHEIEELKKSGNTLLADTLESIRQVVIGRSNNSLTRIYEEYKEKRNEETTKVLRELIEAAKTKFSFDEACNFYEKLIAIERSLKNLFGYADLLYSLNDFTKAKQYYEEILVIYRALAKKNPQAYNPYLALTLNNLGLLYSNNNELKQAKDCHQEALVIRRELVKKSPQAYNQDLAMTLNNLGLLLGKNNELKQAKDCYQEALVKYRELAKKNPQVYNPELASVLNNLGVLLNDNKEPKQAKEYHQEALEIRRELVRKKPQVYNSYLAMTLSNLAVLLANNNELEQAKDYYQEALVIRRELAVKNPEAYNPDLATTLNNLGAALLSNNNETKQAKDYFQEALKIRRELAKKNPKAYNPYLVSTLNNLAVLYYRINNQEDAEKAYKEALSIIEILAKNNPSAYEIHYAQTLTIGIFYLGKDPKDIEQIKATLQKYPDSSRAKELLEKIKSWEEENPKA
ncbi:hypothetical protein HQ40_04460 [Porphyromonas gulae]|uniref:tetratricopeptide repeat protein n=1 Tax=Porphyromonas gulae TaxID=111105 RepID=UPI00052CC4BE|nr:tetratricopeptide repeat protein [Porphyromonas gulae]KGN76046.1 hypothetical protein HQ40_04460 [Porphyromonas gulae]